MCMCSNIFVISFLICIELQLARRIRGDRNHWRGESVINQPAANFLPTCPLVSQPAPLPAKITWSPLLLCYSWLRPWVATWEECDLGNRILTYHCQFRGSFTRANLAWEWQLRGQVLTRVPRKKRPLRGLRYLKQGAKFVKLAITRPRNFAITLVSLVNWYFTYVNFPPRKAYS